MHISVIAIGSQGDVQPLLALALGLQKAGHVVQFISGEEYRELCAAYGMELQSIGIDLKQTMAKHTNLFQFASEISPKILRCFSTMDRQDAVVATFLGVSSVPAALDAGIPCFYAVPIPGLPTRDFPYPTLPPFSLGAGYNLLTHKAMEALVKASFPPARRLLQSPRPTYLHFFSTHVVPRPSDWDAYPFAHITGFWYLDRPPAWQPSQALLDFLAAGPAPISIGFGSVVDQEAQQMTEIALEALAQTGQRGIFTTGWGGMVEQASQASAFFATSIPYDWLFARVRCAIHHGGAGTTALAMRAGVVSIAIPSGLDQPFWGERIKRLGAGPAPIARKQLTVERLVAAIRSVLENTAFQHNAGEIGQKLRKEDGVKKAVQIIEQT